MDDDHSPRDPAGVDLWVGALDGPDGPVLRAAVAADRYIRAEVEAGLEVWEPWMRILLISHLVRDLREHPDGRPIQSFGRALIASFIDIDRIRRIENNRPLPPPDH